MNSRIPAALKATAYGVDIVFAVSAVFYSLFLLSWEGGYQAAIIMLLFTWGYAIPNIGAIIATSKAWRIVWTIPAILSNLAYLVSVVSSISNISVTLPAILDLIILGLVALNSATMIVAFRMRRNQPALKIAK